MKKTIWVLFVVGLLVLGCVSMKDQPAYESSFGNNLGLMKLYAKYPECQD